MRKFKRRNPDSELMIGDDSEEIELREYIVSMPVSQTKKTVEPVSEVH